MLNNLSYVLLLVLLVLLLVLLLFSAVGKKKSKLTKICFVME